ncbi:response regulator transcription factor [Colwellia ponticola]|uniref:Response regulator transcription factor n=1 Tax=Colwellia ponticola TaxID=2304625 RepID=A0A8H2JNH5_9GAMM|nr:LuxR C-terminal-related transcriptional regulator [Colwellia ponticola]TMM47767.1 response regulator transcription factor [Colwellia ponticola]
MPNDTFNSQISTVISALNSPSFTPKLMGLISSVFSFDCAVILGCREGGRPIYLYDSIKNYRGLLFQSYLTASFQHDPFYQQLNTNKQQGVFRLVDVVKKDLDYKAYCKKFYEKTGWIDELSMLIKIETERWVMLCFGYTSEGNYFSKQQVNELKPYFSIIQSLCQQHWKSTELNFSESVDNLIDYSDSMGEFIKYALATFGKEILTKREQEIARLIVQGFDSKKIANQLNITEGTVKNHRKRIYTQLNVASLSEVFQLFLNHLITHLR